MTERSRTILVSGMVGGVPGHGGASWAVLQYLIGLDRLGHDVWFVEPVTTFEGAPYLRSVLDRYGFAGRWAMLRDGGTETAGLPYDDLVRRASRTDLVVNIAGMLTDPALLTAAPCRVYLDLDPAFTQLWQEVEGIDMRFGDHTHFVTVGLRVGSTGSRIPSCGRRWLTTRPPVVLEEWPVSTTPATPALTTVGNFRGYGSIEHDGVLYGQKVHSLRRLTSLPRRLPVPVCIALAVDPSEVRDLQDLEANGWRLVEPEIVAGDPDRYRDFVSSSWAELGITKRGYVVSESGWFSDRSACYLAAGRPVVAEDTGLSHLLPTDEGFLTFRDPDEAVEAVCRVAADYERHRSAARAFAEEFLDARKILPDLLRRLGLS